MRGGELKHGKQKKRGRSRMAWWFKGTCWGRKKRRTCK